MQVMQAAYLNNNNNWASSVNTFDLYKLSMSKDMTVLRRQYDRSKHELKTKRERLAQLERDWDSLHALNRRDDNFRGDTAS
jgi:hypothetical protein